METEQLKEVIARQCKKKGTQQGALFLGKS